MASELKLGLHTIGFVRPQGKQVTAIGSGTCVSFGGLRGILTADHVPNDFRDNEELGLLQFPVRDDQFQSIRIPRGFLDEVRVGFQPYDELGPDLAFVRLPAPFSGTVEANSSFFDFQKQAEMAFKSAPADTDSFDAIAGVIEIWREGPVVRGNLGTTVIRGLANIGAATPLPHGREGFDRLLFTPTPEEGFVLPRTYGATSGGGLMRVFVEKGTKNLVELRLLGPAYYETDLKNGMRNLICHGPRSVYERLADRIIEKWGNEI